MGLSLLSLDLTQPTTAVPTGAARIIVDEGSSAGPLTISIPGITAGLVSMAPAASPSHAYQFDASGLAPATYDYTVSDAGTTHLPDLTGSFTINAVPVVNGCTDPDADNYNASANTNDGSCVTTQRLTVAALPTLAPLGVPLNVVLASVAVAGAVPAPATVTFDLGNLGTTAGVQLRLNGYLFTSGPLIVPGRFTDATSLLAAMQALPALSAAYAFTTPTSTTVRATATVPGLSGLPTASTSRSAAVSVATTTGTAALFSQRRHQWGCYLEVWAGCGSAFGGATSKASAVLAGRFVLPYRADNAYAFDVASLLRPFTGHAAPVAGVCADRLVSYFVRFGEEYADSATGLRRVRSVYESAVAWGLEAMEVPAEVAPGLRLLTARPRPWRTQPLQALPCGLLATPDALRHLLLRTRPATSRTTTDTELLQVIATGQVVFPSLATITAAGTALLASALSGSLHEHLTPPPGQQLAVLASFDFTAQGQALTFVNRQGSEDTVYFAGTSDPGSKRTAATYTNAVGPQSQAAEVALPTKLTSGLLSYAEWDWLRRELSVSPAVRVNGVAVLLSDVVAEADPVKQEYTLTVDYQPAPVRGLSN